MPILRTYRTEEDAPLSFREAWYDEETEQFVINRGEVGRLSETPVVEDDVDPAHGESLLAAFADACATDGYRELGRDEQSWVHLRFPLKQAAPKARDESLRKAVVSALTGHLAWRGLGTIEADGFGPSRLTISVLTPAPKAAMKSTLTCLRETVRSDVNRAVLAVADGATPERVKVIHPRNHRGEFDLSTDEVAALENSQAQGEMQS